MLNLPLYILDEDELTAEAASHTFTLSGYTIPSWAVHLVILYTVQSKIAGSEDTIELRINADSGSNYNFQRLTGTSTTASSAKSDSQTGAHLGQMSGATGIGSNGFGGGMVLIPEYANTARHKLILAQNGRYEFNTYTHVARWASTAAVTSIVIRALSANLEVGSRFTLAVVDERYSVRAETLSADGALDFQNIPALDDIAGIAVVRSSRAATTDNQEIRLNNDTIEANYSGQYLHANGSTPSAATTNAGVSFTMPADSADAGVYGLLAFTIDQFAKGNDDPHYLFVSGAHGSSGVITVASGRRNNVEAVNRVGLIADIGPDWMAGSSMWLYRVPKAYVQRVVVTAAGGAASLTLDNIPQNGDALVITLYARGESAVSVISAIIQFNEDTTGSNYDYQDLSGDGTTVAASRSASSQRVGRIPAASAGANIWGGFVAVIPDYTKTDRHKQVIIYMGAAEDVVIVQHTRWKATAAITKVVLSIAGSTDFDQNTVAEVAVVHNLAFQGTTIKTKTRVT